MVRKTEKKIYQILIDLHLFFRIQNECCLSISGGYDPSSSVRSPGILNRGFGPYGGSAGGRVGGATSTSVPGSNGVRPDASFSTTLPSSLQGHSSNSSLGDYADAFVARACVYVWKCVRACVCERERKSAHDGGNYESLVPSSESFFAITTKLSVSNCAHVMKKTRLFCLTSQRFTILFRCVLASL